MRIFYAVSSSPNAVALPQSGLWHRNLYPPLVELGHEVICFDYDLSEHFVFLDPSIAAHQAFIAERRPQLEEALVVQVEQAHRKRPIDLFFSYFYSACVRPETIKYIRSLGILTVNFYCNAAHQFHLVADIAPAYYYCMVPERQALEKYVGVGAHPIHIQMAASPEVYRPFAVPIAYDVTFVGQRYLNRPEWLGYLYRHGIDVRAWGPGWAVAPAPLTNPNGSVYGRVRRELGRVKRQVRRYLAPQPPPAGALDLPAERCGPPLSDQELVEMYSRSHISLNFSEVSDQVTGEMKRHIRLRDFEAPMSGALYFTGYQEELAEYYEIDREVVCYDSQEELLDKVRYYLAHPDQAKEIRDAGLRRAKRDHTWKNRFQQLFDVIGLIG